jgi:hypothetical protein
MDKYDMPDEFIQRLINEASLYNSNNVLKYLFNQPNITFSDDSIINIAGKTDNSEILEMIFEKYNPTLDILKDSRFPAIVLRTARDRGMILGTEEELTKILIDSIERNKVTYADLADALKEYFASGVKPSKEIFDLVYTNGRQDAHQYMIDIYPELDTR